MPIKHIWHSIEAQNIKYSLSTPMQIRIKSEGKEEEEENIKYRNNRLNIESASRNSTGNEQTGQY